MKREQDMQWQNEPPACGWYISHLYRKSFTEFASLLKDLGLSAAQSIVLVGIYRNDGINQRTLADKIVMGTGVVSRVLRELEDKGYVEKERDEQNRRNYLLHLTADGRQLTEKSLELQAEYWNGELKNLSPEEITVLNGLLKKMTS